jgi:hypothetical protein
MNKKDGSCRNKRKPLETKLTFPLYLTIYSFLPVVLMRAFLENDFFQTTLLLISH